MNASLVRFLAPLLMLLTIGLATPFVSGCATMATIDQQVSITSDPPDADVKIGALSGTTPLSVTVPTGYSIPQGFQIDKPGYQPQTVSIQRGFRTSALVQDIVPGVFLAFIPLIVDAITGDWYYVANTTYHVRLLPLKDSGDSERK